MTLIYALTPNPSPFRYARERGAILVCDLPPLPWGEGWGEGGTTITYQKTTTVFATHRHLLKQVANMVKPTKVG